MKKLFLISLLILSSACATTQNAPNLTPLAVTQYNLTQLVDAIGILQTSAENAVPANILPVNTARLIVQFCVTANTTIGQVPNGWYVSVNTAYLNVKLQLTPNELIKFGPYLASFEVVFNTFKGV